MLDPLPDGLPLRAIDLPLTHVSTEHERRPTRAVDLNELLAPHQQDIEEAERWQPHVRKALRTGAYDQALPWLPETVFDGFSFDQAAKTWYGSVVRNPLAERFNLRGDAPDYHHELLAKIASSQWRWGVERDWNALVDFARGLPRFDLSDVGLDVTLDWTTGYNERGYSRHTRTYLDGALGYLIRREGRHVATLGISLARDRWLLVQQVQLKEAKGNRWLFRLPSPLLDLVIERLDRAFPELRLALADGGDLASMIANNYNAGEGPDEEEQERIARRYQRRLGGFRRRGWTRINKLRFHALHRRSAEIDLEGSGQRAA